MLFSSGIRRAVDQYGSSSDAAIRLMEKRAQLRRRHTCSVIEDSTPTKSPTTAPVSIITKSSQQPGSSRQVSFILPSSDEDQTKPSAPSNVQRPLSSCLVRVSNTHGSPKKKAN
jgi:hypothetical protein